MLHEISAIRSRQAKIYSLDELPIPFQIGAQNLLCEFIWVQPSLGSDLRQLRFFFGL